LFENVGNLEIPDGFDQIIKAQQTKEQKLQKISDLSKQDHPVNFTIPGLKIPLYNYQNLGVMFALTNDQGVLIADEMGLGKTGMGIATAVYLKSLGRAKKVLVVVPASLKYNWPLEIEKFTDEKYVVIDGTPEERIKQWLRDDVFFYVVNYELVVEDLFGGRTLLPKKDETLAQRIKREVRIAKVKAREKVLQPIRARVFDILIGDEIHFCKHKSARRSLAMSELKAKFKIGLTGTPVDGKLEELHSVMNFVMPGLLGSKTRFFQRYVKQDFWGKVTGYMRISEVTERIKPFFIRRLKNEVLKDLPDKIYMNIPVIFTPSEMKIYKELATHGHAATEDAEAMVAIIRCKQFCNWPFAIDPNCTDSSKVDALKEVLDEVVTQNGHKALIFSQYKETVNVLVEVLDDMHMKYLRIDGDTDKEERAKMQKQFEDDKTIDVMIGTEAMSLGLNFVSASYVLNFDDNWSPSIMAQREDRAHRLGQKNVVTVVNFIVKDSIEQRIRSVLYGKSKISASVLGDDTDESVLQRLNPKEIAKLL